MEKDATLLPLPKKHLSDIAAEALLSYIDDMKKAGKMKLPPEIELARALGVSRTTIRRTLSDMENRGIVLRLHGKGTFINPNENRLRLNFASSQPFISLIESCGYKASQKMFGFIKSAPSIMQQSQLHLSEDDEIITISKVYLADKSPAAISITSFPQKLFTSEITTKKANLPAYLLLQKHAGIICKREETTISSIPTSDTKAYTNGETVLNSLAVLELDTTAYSDQNEPVYLSKQFIDTNYLQFHLLRSLDVY